MTYLRHDAVITVGPANIDVTLELTFYEMRSLVERRRMDCSRDGAISVAEMKAYLADRAELFDDGITLTVGGRRLELTPLYEPQIDLLGVEQVFLSHHVLRLFYFARTPTWLQAGDEIVLEDRLWPTTPALGGGQVRGKGGIEVSSTIGGEVSSTLGHERRPPVTRARCQAVPADVGYRPTRAGPAPAVPTKPLPAGGQEAAAGGVTGLGKSLGPAKTIGLMLLLAVGAIGGTRRSGCRRHT